jgi:hypothetical protein
MRIVKAISNHTYMPSILVGVFAFYIIVGPLALLPTNIAWLGARFDPTQHYLGWAFYREAPWNFPLGLNPGFGMDISSSIIYSDSIPLVAFLLKPFSNLLPETFQYLGAWLLLCFIFQSIFGYLLTGLFTQDKIIRLIGAALFSFSPVLIWRIDQHVALVSHFLILFGLFLCLRKNKQHQFFLWAILILSSALVQFYICTILLALWISDLITRRFVQNSLNNITVVKEFFIIATLLFIALLISGFFVINSKYSVTNHYGLLRLNLLSLFDSGGWSYLLKDIKDTPIVYDQFKVILGSYYESYGYLGLGGIFMLVLTIVIALKNRSVVIHLLLRYRYLSLCLFLLTAFAISNNIGIGPFNASFQLPKALNSIASILRASGRFFWPAYYVILLASIYFLTRFFPRKWALTVLTFSLVLQVIDTYPGWGPLRKSYMVQPSSVNPFLKDFLKSPFWDEAGKKYQSVELIPLNADLQWQDNWLLFASYANQHHMNTNAVFLSRTDYEKLNAANEKYNQVINSGSYYPSALYILDDSKVLAAIKDIDSSKDLFANINGFNVIAPNWFKCTNCQAVSEDLLFSKSALTPKRNQAINFLSPPFDSPIYFTSGWVKTKSMETWSIWDKSELTLLLPSEYSNSLTLSVDALVSPTHPSQEVQVLLDGVNIVNQSLTKKSMNIINIPLGDKENTAGIIKITFKFKNQISPQALGISDESQALAISIKNGVFGK